MDTLHFWSQLPGPGPLSASHCSQKEVKLRPPPTLSLCVPACATNSTRYTRGSSQSVGSRAGPLPRPQLDHCPGILPCARQPGWSLSTPHTADESGHLGASHTPSAPPPLYGGTSRAPPRAQGWPEVMFPNVPATQWTLNASFFLPYEHTPSFLYKSPMVHKSHSGRQLLMWTGMVGGAGSRESWALRWRHQSGTLSSAYQCVKQEAVCWAPKSSADGAAASY